jgi:hypothetical protein
MMKLSPWLCTALLLGSTAAFAAPDSCERVKSDIQQKIINNGVPESGFSLTIVPNDQPDQPGAQVVGHCANDTFKIIRPRLAGSRGRRFIPAFSLRCAAAAVQEATHGEERIVWGACSVNCGSRCALRSHVRDDEVVWVETDNTGADIYGDHQVRACLRGRSIRRRINHPDRLNYPMKRVGKRGEGKFERISWEEALDAIAASLKTSSKSTATKRFILTTLPGLSAAISPAPPLTPRWWRV